MALGSLAMMWIVQQINLRGVGNGVGLVILCNLLCVLSRAIELSASLPKLFLFAGASVVGVVMLTTLMLGTRAVPVQYAKRVVGRRVYGGQMERISIRIDYNTARTQAVIWYVLVSTILAVPFFYWSTDSFLYERLLELGSPTSALGIVAFVVVYTVTYLVGVASLVNPATMADRLKARGGFVPGVRPGRRTSLYLDRILTRISFGGLLATISIFLILSLLSGWLRLLDPVIWFLILANCGTVGLSFARWVRSTVRIAHQQRQDLAGESRVHSLRERARGKVEPTAEMTERLDFMLGRLAESKNDLELRQEILGLLGRMDRSTPEYREFLKRLSSIVLS